MTDMSADVPEDVDWSDVEGAADAAYPEYPANPNNHRFTLSLTPKEPPFLVVRGNTAAELMAAFEELEESAAYAAMGAAYASMKAQAALAAGLGPVTPVPPAPQAPAPAPQGATPPPFGPNVSVPAAPGYVGPPAPAAPAAPAWGGNGGGQANTRGPKPRPDWPQVYKINVPFQAKDNFKAFREQYKDAFKGKVSWAGGGEYWVHPDVVQSFANYSPVAA